MQLKSVLFFVLINIGLFAQERTTIAQDITLNQHIDGTLLIPNEATDPPLAIIIAGSGPTDRNGNQNFMKNDALKKLAEALSRNGIASFRYDKRIVKQIRQRKVDDDIMFDDFVTDAKSALKYFKEKYSFKAVYFIGHSQGSLVGMLAASEGADGFISLAGAGKPIDEVILDQIEMTAPMFMEDSKRIFDLLKKGKTTDDYPPALASIFNKDVQPFMSNWMQYDPQQEIKSLAMPILIVNGTKDLQVMPEEAQLLKNANKTAELHIIENMNHILVPIAGDDLENSKSYNETQRELSAELIDKIVDFINQ